MLWPLWLVTNLMVRDVLLELYLVIVGLDPHSQTWTEQSLYYFYVSVNHLVVFLDRSQVEIIFLLTGLTVLD